MNMDEKQQEFIRNEAYWMFLCKVPGLNNVFADKLIEALGGVRFIYEADELELRMTAMYLGIKEAVIEDLIGARAGGDPLEAYMGLANKGMNFVSRRHPDFPKRLLSIEDPPNGIFYRGRLPASTNPAIAIVGSRACSNYGRDVALHFAQELAKAGVDIISGMAAGIDGFAHRGALGASQEFGSGDTYAVLGTGVDICYPSGNRDIYDSLIEEGGIVSEYYPGTPGQALNFPRRNRLISGLADGVLVVEARERSGTWITVDMGLEQGKDIYAIPGRIDDPLSLGCNRIIRQGGRLVTCPQDILADMANRYGYLVDRASQGDLNHSRKSKTMNLTPTEKRIYNKLTSRPKTADALAMSLKLSIMEVTATATMLEMRGLIESVSNGVYAKRRRR